MLKPQGEVPHHLPWHQPAGLARENLVYHHVSTEPSQHKYIKCLIGGAFASSIRLVTNPLEVIKGYSQVGRYPSSTGIFRGLQTLWLEEGFKGLFKGVGPTAIAYACQTGTKYSLYEFFKDSSSSYFGPNYTKEYRQLIYVSSAGCAEAIADILMCPWEQLRVKVQTSPNNTFPTKLRPALLAMISNRTHPFGALRTLWMRQVPATITNFFVFENAVQTIYQHVLRYPKDSYSKSAQLTVSLIAGYVSGVCCAVVSHPADSLLSLRSQPVHEGKSIMQIVNEVGFVKLATLGLPSRMLLTGTIVGSQWIIYDTFKTAMGMGTSGSDGSD
jgi:solute carrier family 25 phosphate transporter 3